MKKRKFAQFYEKNWGWIYFFSEVFLLSLMVLSFKTEGFPIWIGICNAIAWVVCTVLIAVKLAKWAHKIERKEQEEICKKMQELNLQDQYYIDLVNRKASETISKFKEESADLVVKSDANIYLIPFFYELNNILENAIVGKPDSFIIASCLMCSLISNPIIKSTNSDEFHARDVVRNINIDIALSCALEIISKPSTYFEDNGIWVERKHSKVDIVIPKGIIENEELYQRIKKTIFLDKKDDEGMSILQFSNLLHLIYLYNCEQMKNMQ